MYPKSLKANVEQDFQTITARLAGICDRLVPSGMVDTLDSADRAGKLFREAGIDALIVVEGTYVPDFISLHAINHVKRVPVLFFSTQTEDNLDPKSNYEHSLRNSGLIGVAQLTGTFRKMERSYRVVVGSIQDERAYERIQAFLQAVQAIEDVREANIGVIGHVFRGMYDLELSKTFFKSAFDVNIINIQSSHLLDEWQAVAGPEVEEQTGALLARFKTRGVARDDVYRAVRLSVALHRLAEKFRLNALCFLDQHFIQRQTQTSARIGASLMMENTDLVATCEGDLGGLVMMLMMRSISGQAGLMGEWGEYDAASNSCFVIGHGIGTPDLAVSDEAITLTPTPEEWGFTGAGLNYEYIMKPGKATLGHFIETAHGYKMLVSPVESIPYPTLEYNELHAMLKVKKPVKEYLEEILMSGVTHHCIVGLGDMSQTLTCAAELLNLKTLYIE
jgi:L-arabinose isomerase